MRKLTMYEGFKPMKDKVFVHQLEKGERTTKSGIVVLNDNLKESGIRPRWAQVCAVGKDVHGVEVGDWVLIEHGRWSFGIKINGGDDTIWQLDYPKGALLASDVKPDDIIIGGQ